MQVAPFSLPSAPGVTIYLREATVADCEQFADTDSRHDERLTTMVLRALQSSPEHFSDPIDWTASDRQLAAFWYYAHTTDDPSMHLPYDCPHCGEQHDALVPLTDIAEQYQAIKGLPYRFIEHDGERYAVHPLDGHAVEELEGLRAELPDDANSAEYNRLQAVIRRHELVASLAAPDDTRPREARIRDIERAVRTMSLGSARALHQKVQQSLDDMEHGLPSAVSDGEVLLLSPPLTCEQEAGHSTRLRFPVQWSNYIPRLW